MVSVLEKELKSYYPCLSSSQLYLQYIKPGFSWLLLQKEKHFLRRSVEASQRPVK